MEIKIKIKQSCEENLKYRCFSKNSHGTSVFLIINTFKCLFSLYLISTKIDFSLIDCKYRSVAKDHDSVYYRGGSKRIRPQYLIVALVIIGEGEVGGRHLVLLCPPAAHSAIGKISISEPPTPLRDRSYQIARLVLLPLSVSSGRFVVERRLIVPIGNKGKVIERK